MVKLCHEETLQLKLQVQSNGAFEYLGKILITQWQNTQCVTTRKLPQPQKLPALYGIVTLNMSKCINSMIEEYRSESRTELLEGTLHHMTQRISDKRQEYSTERGDDIVPKVGNSFHKTAAMEVAELFQGNQYMVNKKKCSTLNINLNANRQTTEME